MKKIAVSVLAALAVSTGAPAFAQANNAAAPAGAASNASVRSLLDSMHYRDVIAASNKTIGDNVQNMMRVQAEAAIRNNTALSEEGRKAEQAKLEKQLPRAVAVVRGVLNDPKLVDELYNEAIPLYSRYFTSQELEQLAAFYRTPTGQKTLKVMPQLMADAMQMGQRLVAPRIQAALQAAAKAPADK